jgi:hypothetical protein
MIEAGRGQRRRRRKLAMEYAGLCRGWDSARRGATLIEMCGQGRAGQGGGWPECDLRRPQEEKGGSKRENGKMVAEKVFQEGQFSQSDGMARDASMEEELLLLQCVRAGVD